MGGSKSFGDEKKPLGNRFRTGIIGYVTDHVRAGIDNAFQRMEHGGYTLKLCYDFDVDGGAQGVYTLGTTEDVVPKDAFVYKAWYVVEDTLTSATDAATVKIGITGQDDVIKAATAISDGTNPWDAGLHDGDADGTATNASTRTDEDRSVILTIGDEDLTAGKLCVYVKYFNLYGVPAPIEEVVPPVDLGLLAASFDGVSGYATIDDIAEFAYANTSPAVHHVLLVKAPAVTVEQQLISVTPNVATYPRQTFRGAASNGAQRVAVQQSGPLVQDVTGTDVFQDGEWHLIQWSTWLDGGQMKIYHKVDGEALVGPDADTFTPFVWTPEKLVLGSGWANGAVGFVRVDLAYYAMFTGEQWEEAKWDALYDAWATGGGKEDLTAITDAILEGLENDARLRWAGALDGNPGHVAPHGDITYTGGVTFEPALFDDAAPGWVGTREGYHIGNSLTRDTLGWQASSGVDLTALDTSLTANRHAVNYSWHLQCGQPLKVINETPAADPGCWVTSPDGLWPTALAANNYDYITVQPHPGTDSTLNTDLAAFASFAALQPSSTRIILLCGSATRDDILTYWGGSPPALSDPDNPDTIRTEAYFDLLWTRLIEIYGDQLSWCPTAHINAQLCVDANLGNIPGIADHTELYRDNTHPSSPGAVVYTATMAAVLAGRPLAFSGGWLGSVNQDTVNYIVDAVNTYLLNDPRSRVKE